jgi:hypothetical protein
VFGHRERQTRLHLASKDSLPAIMFWTSEKGLVVASNRTDLIIKAEVSPASQILCRPIRQLPSYPVNGL